MKDSIVAMAVVGVFGSLVAMLAAASPTPGYSSHPAFATAFAGLSLLFLLIAFAVGAQECKDSSAR